ncbi:band 4.1-like protein 4 isoform X2 [Labrus mixtus]|uniref:band 4.1-like protein 4 isoform X2 n=1 Tax=Labrus mixtus TaxID=508554 RepID=UPI0029C04566|nr:band 4.1-like protein 4 isoform X2 [Labrus mixtus]
MLTCFRGNREEFYGEVLLLDERKITLTGNQGLKKSSRAAVILDQVFSLLQVEEVEFFGLRFCDDKQQMHWLDPSRTISQHRELIGPPYVFYFGVKFYVEDPSKLKEETTRFQFYLQVCQDVRRGRLPCPAHLKPQLFALMLQADGGEWRKAGQREAGQREAGQREAGQMDDKVKHIYRSIGGVSRPQAQSLVLSLSSSLQMFGVFLFAAYGENQTEYFLGPTPVGVVIYKNKVLVGKYFWQRISKLHFKDETFELRVIRKNGSETSFFFQTSGQSDCRRLWRCCVEHHVFFRMSERNPKKHKSVSRSPSFSLRHLNFSIRKKTINKTTEVCKRLKHHTNHRVSDPITTQTAPPAIQRSDDGPDPDNVEPSAPWEISAPLSGLFNPKFPPNTNEEEEKQDGGRPQRRSRSLDGDRPIRKKGRRSRSHGNTSSGSESEKPGSNRERHRRSSKNRGCHGDNKSRSRARSCSPDAQTWRHIQKQLVEHEGLIDRQTEEIHFMEVRVLGEPIRRRHAPRGRRHRHWASTSNRESNTKMVPPLPVTKATITSGHLPTIP